MPVENLVNGDQASWKLDYIVESSIHHSSPSDFKLKHPIKRVAVIGAGPAGLPTAKVLRDEGLEVVIYERSPVSGGTWIYNPKPPLGPTYPANVPSQLVQPSLPPPNKPLPFEIVSDFNDLDVLRHAPPTPCYQSLRNNVATPLLKYKDLDWPANTPWFTTHDKILDYLQAYSKQFGLDDITEFDTSLEKLTELPQQAGWRVLTKKVTLANIQDNDSGERKVIKTSWKEEIFDAVVLSTGHYHAPFIPDIPGLSEWKHRYPDSIIHSKQYRVPGGYEEKNILIIGDGTSALDISRDIGDRCNIIYQSVRDSNHGFDEKYRAFREEVKTWLPPNVQRVSTINNIKFDTTSNSSPGTAIIELGDGSQLTGVDAIIICTGYLFNYHFLQELHDDNDSRRLEEDKVLVKQDGSQLFNLHKDIFYIPNPTLSFIGVPFHIATFSFFEFQAYAVARVYSQSAFLPTPERMRSEWADRLKRKGNGREFHALGADLEQEYIQDIVKWVNSHGAPFKKPVLEGHSQAWFDVKDNAFEALRLEFKQRLQLDDLRDTQGDGTITATALSA